MVKLINKGTMKFPCSCKNNENIRNDLSNLFCCLALAALVISFVDCKSRLLVTQVKFDFPYSKTASGKYIKITHVITESAKVHRLEVGKPATDAYTMPRYRCLKVD